MILKSTDNIEAVKKQFFDRNSIIDALNKLKVEDNIKLLYASNEELVKNIKN